MNIFPVPQIPPVTVYTWASRGHTQTLLFDENLTDIKHVVTHTQLFILVLLLFLPFSFRPSASKDCRTRVQNLI